MPAHFLKIIKLSPNTFESFVGSSHFWTFVDICLLIVCHCDEFIIATPFGSICLVTNNVTFSYTHWPFVYLPL